MWLSSVVIDHGVPFSVEGMFGHGAREELLNQPRKDGCC